MDLKEATEQKTFAVVGDTLDEEKYAHKIKRKLIKYGYTVFPVSKELASLNDIDEDIDIVDLCINPAKGLEYLKECKKSFKTVIVEPGAGDDKLMAYLNEKKIPFIEGSILVGLKRFAG